MPQELLLPKPYWNRLLAGFSVTTFKSSAKSGLSSAHSSNNSWRKKSRLLLQPGGKSTARACREGWIVVGPENSAPVGPRSEPGSSSVCLKSTHQGWVLILAVDPWAGTAGQGGGCPQGTASPCITAGPSPGPKSSACLKANGESVFVCTQIIYFKSVFLVHSFILLYCNVSTRQWSNGRSLRRTCTSEKAPLSWFYRPCLCWEHMWWCNYADVIKSVQILAGGTRRTAVKRSLLSAQFSSNYTTQLSCARRNLGLKSGSHVRVCVGFLLQIKIWKLKWVRPCLTQEHTRINGLDNYCP